MPANIQVYSRFSSRINRKAYQAGSLEVPITFSLTNSDVYERSDTVANAVTNQVIYADELASFNFLWIASDYNTSILLTDTASNTFRIRLRGTGSDNKLGVPFILGSDVSSTGNEINSIKISNSSGNTAHYYFVVVD